jgi:hypothetical protein
VLIKHGNLIIDKLFYMTKIMLSFVEEAWKKRNVLQSSEAPEVLAHKHWP